jgi:hypothetical protein
VIRVRIRLYEGLVVGVLEVSRGWISYGVNRCSEESGQVAALLYSLLFVVVRGMNRMKTYERDSGDDAMKKG